MSERTGAGKRAERPVRITVDGESVEGIEGQSIAGVLLGSGRISWRETAVAGKPRGLLCGIGVCFDCLVTVDGVPDVRACQRRACDGDEVSSQ
ncbi:(2Fe-2S)-binding protein [Pseudoclavibacter helvolus]|uniref:(2Fe-2S)-binding protein n=1 Tax=Pseudoclavibacter helvolus TaxID=255205 RepID=UPI0024AD0959|nr:(2Fe-2S)-binding protein [Pseudoclavibacter helvolus]